MLGAIRSIGKRIGPCNFLPCAVHAAPSISQPQTFTTPAGQLSPQQYNELHGGTRAHFAGVHYRQKLNRIRQTYRNQASSGQDLSCELARSSSRASACGMRLLIIMEIEVVGFQEIKFTSSPQTQLRYHDHPEPRAPSLDLAYYLVNLLTY